MKIGARIAYSYFLLIGDMDYLAPYRLGVVTVCRYDVELYVVVEEMLRDVARIFPALAERVFYLLTNSEEEDDRLLAAGAISEMAAEAPRLAVRLAKQLELDQSEAVADEARASLNMVPVVRWRQRYKEALQAGRAPDRGDYPRGGETRSGTL